MRMYEDLVAHGVQDLLKREYGDSLLDSPEVNRFVHTVFFFVILK